jgi:hypothetical protein
MGMQGNTRVAKVEELRQAVLALHKRMIDEQRIRYERLHGRIQTTSEFLGLVLEHPEFEWIRAVSALVAQLDEWREASEAASDQELEDIVAALRQLIQREGANSGFTQKYWEMIESTPAVLIEHVKLTRILGGEPRGAQAG